MYRVRGARSIRSGRPAFELLGRKRPGALQLRDGRVDLAALRFQQPDLAVEPAERDPELRGPAVAQIVEVEHPLDLDERKTDFPAHQRELEAGAGPARKKGGPPPRGPGGGGPLSL